MYGPIIDDCHEMCFAKTIRIGRWMEFRINLVMFGYVSKYWLFRKCIVIIEWNAGNVDSVFDDWMTAARSILLIVLQANAKNSCLQWKNMW